MRSLYERPELSTGNRLYGALFTPEEATEVAARFDLSGDVAKVWDHYTSEGGRAEDFAGMLIDHAAGGKLAVYTTLQPERYDELGWTAKLDDPERLEIRHAAISFQELDDLALRLQEAMRAEDPAVGDLTGLHLDVAANAVVAYVDPDSLSQIGEEDRRTDLAQQFPGARLVVEAKEREPGVGAVAVIGGRGWGYYANQGWCTTAFKVRRTGLDPDYMLTAGHCMNGDPSTELRETIYKGAILVGRKTGAWWFEDGAIADVGLLREKTNDGYEGDFQPYVRHNSYKVPVRGVSSDYTADDELRCVTGRKTGTDCGTIVTAYYNVEIENFDPVIHLWNLVKFRTQTTCGDSGGAVYAYIGGNAYANGVYGGGGPHDSCPLPGDTFNYSFYSKWRNIPSAWEVVLSTAPPDTSPCPPTCQLDDPQDDA